MARLCTQPSFENKISELNDTAVLVGEYKDFASPQLNPPRTPMSAVVYFKLAERLLIKHTQSDPESDDYNYDLAVECNILRQVLENFAAWKLAVPDYPTRGFILDVKLQRENIKRVIRERRARWAALRAEMAQFRREHRANRLAMRRGAAPDF